MVGLLNRPSLSTMTRFAASLRSSARMFAVTSLWGCAVALSAAADRTITFPDIAVDALKLTLVSGQVTSKYHGTDPSVTK